MSLPDKKSRIECDVLVKILPSLEGLYTPPKRDKTKKTRHFQGEAQFPKLCYLDSQGESTALLLALEEKFPGA